VIELREELARASAMLDVRRFDEASALLARVVSAEPESSRAWCLMARAHLGAERYTEAISAANRAVSLDPADEWPHRLASNALVHLGNFPDALRAADEACRLAPGYWQTHVCVAQAALAGQRPGVAAEAASRARALAPNEPDVHFLSGKVSLARGQLAEAREHQEQALALDPAHSGAMNELGRIRLRRHDTAGAIRHFISAARATPEERIYSRNIDVVLLRTVSRTIYVFTLLALILIWIPAVTHLDRLPFVIALGMTAGLTAACFAWIVLRMPREARRLVRRTLRAPRVAAALALAAGGVAVAFGLVAFTPAADLTEVLPVAVVITVAARLAAFAALRGAARKHLLVVPSAVRPGDPADRPQGEHGRAAQQAVDGPHAEDRGRPERGGQRPVDRVPDHADAVSGEDAERADPGE
jgi:tetratricopeptide (TPR) repeat protein